MIMKKSILLAAIGALVWGVPVAAEETNLLADGSFEDYSCNALGCQWNEWTMPLGSGSANTTDKIDGSASLQMTPTTASVLDQPVAIADASYAAGTIFELKFFYQVLTMPEGKSLNTDCYWEAAPGGDAEAMKEHDAVVLQQEVTTTVTEGWDSIVIQTSKPSKSSGLRVRFKVPKNAKVLFDAFSMTEKEQFDPYITVSPATVKSVTTTIGNTAVFETIHLKHGHVTSETTFRVGGTDAAHFQLSASSLPADQSETDIVVTYAPKAAGTHRASLIFDNVNHTTILPDMITLNGTCSDPSAKPEISVTPSTLPTLEANVGQQVTQTVSVTSINCTDYVYMRVDHIQGAAFTIDGTMLPKNATSDVTIRFAPREAGTYQSTLTFYSENAESVVLTLNGTGRNPTPETVDWQTDFHWDMSHPLAVLDEHFDGAPHNQTLLLDGWQNVAAAEARPWWGFDESKTSPVRGEGQYAKATAYQSGKESTGTWDMWLVTPALDYKNAPAQVFAFSVMGEYMPEEGIQALFELYYIDATDTNHVFFQAFDGLSIPSTADENNVWVPFQIHLENQANIPDVFYMAFRYVGPNGNKGVVTYYIDDVSWGVVSEGIEAVRHQPSDVSTKKLIRNGQLIIVRGDAEYNAQGAVLSK